MATNFTIPLSAGATKAPFTIPSNVATNIRNQNTDILVNDVVKTGAVTVGIDETLKLKPHENYVIDFAVIVFNDDTRPNGLSEFPMTISDNEATFKNDKLSSDWTFNTIVYSASYEEPTIPEPNDNQWLITQEMLDDLDNSNVILYYDNRLITERTIIDPGKIMRIVPKNGYEFGTGSYARLFHSGAFGQETRNFTKNGTQEASLTISNTWVQFGSTLLGFDVFVNELITNVPAPLVVNSNTNIHIRNNKGKIYLNNNPIISGEITINVNDTFKIVPEDGYIVKKAEMLFNDGNIPFEIIDNEAIFVNNVPTSDKTQSQPINVTFETEKEAFRIDITQEIIDNAALNKSTIFLDGVAVTSPVSAFDGQEIRLVAEEGWKFYHRPANSTSVHLRFNSIFGDYLLIYFELSPNEFEAFTVVNSERYEGYNFVTLEVSTTQIKAESTGTNNVYQVTDAEIRGLNDERYRTRVISEDGQTQIEFVDFGDYIINLMQLPFKLDESVILDEEAINLGNRTITTKAPVVAKDNIKLDMGSITIDGEGNSLDYQGVTTVLHLPWLSKVIIDSSYVINQTINIVYNIDMYTSDTVVNVYSTAVDNGEKPFYTTTGSIGTQIPFAGYKYYLTGPENKGVNTSALNNLTRAFIEVIKPDAPLKDDFFSASVSDAGTLENESGYIEVDNAKLEFKALPSEKESIINIIRGGIIL